MTAASSNNVDMLKSQGNAAFSGGEYATAISHFSEAIALAPENHVLFWNRNAAYAALKITPHATEHLGALSIDGRYLNARTTAPCLNTAQVKMSLSSIIRGEFGSATSSLDQ